MTGTTEDLAETPEFVTDAFSQVLDIVHVRGKTARMIVTDEPLSFNVPAGTPSVYIVESGKMILQVGNEQPVELQSKQLALLLQGPPHRISFDALRQTPSQRLATDAGAAAGASAKNTCFWGGFSVDSDLAAKILRSMPALFVLDDLADNPIEWIDMVCKLVLLELDASRPGASLMVSRLLDLLLVQILRRWAQSEDSLPGWLAAAKDDRIARAVSAIHADPTRSLTNAELAKLANMSTSSFAARFKQVMGQQPGAYLRAWRLDQAAEALLHSSTPIEAIADQVGYASKEAFSRAFHAKFGQSPSAWRLSRNS
ncbi:MAG: AraC family transcriptional regulator [Pseudomonadota bacterium]